MLRRSIESVLRQTHRNLTLQVVNDDPEDHAVEEIVASFADDRAAMYRPIRKRGATANFNLVYQQTEADFSALLEDDNWWEPRFLESQIEIMAQHPTAPVVVGNERVWKENPDGSWTDTGQTIWPFGDVRLHSATLASLCGSAVICNSSMLIRTDRSRTLLTPDTIPVDVTEHFRERLLPAEIPLNGAPLVNYAETLATARDSEKLWGQYQIVLIGSVFAALAHAQRRKLAQGLWREVTSASSPRAMTLIFAGIAVAEARELVRQAPILSLPRAAMALARRPHRIKMLRQAPRALRKQFQFLKNAPLVQELAGDTQ